MPTLLSELKQGVLTLTLNRPERANAFNTEMSSALISALVAAQQDAQARCVVITGSGRAFSAGQDISEMKKSGDISYREHLNKTYNPLILQLREMGKPIIAAVNGACAGAAFGIALACDLRIAHSSAFFVVGFGGIALAPDSGVSLLLPKMIGLGRAQEYFYSNKPIMAHLAYQWGMVNQVGGFNYQRLVMQIAQNHAEGPLEAFAAAKHAFNQAVIPNLKEALEYESILQDELGGSAEHQEGIAAFFQKRKPKFSG